MERPIPLALSFVTTAANIAMEVKIKVKNSPQSTSIKPNMVGSNIRITIPAPKKKAKPKAEIRPINRLFQMIFRWIGWLKINSTNSELLYT